MAISFIQKMEGKTRTIYKAHYTDPLTGKRRAKSHKRYKGAKAFLESPKVTGVRKDKAITVAEAADHWLYVCEHIGRKGREPVAKSTLRPYKRHAAYFKRVVIEYEGDEVRFGDILVRKLTREHCEALRNKMTADFSWEYARKHLTSLKSLLDQARADDFMDHRPAEDVYIRAATRKPQYDITDDHKVPDLAELRRLLKTMRTRCYIKDRNARRARRRYKLIFETIAFGGVRPGEAMGLPWDEVYFDRGGIRITQDVDDDGTIGKLKSAAAYRFIPMPDHYMRQLRWWRKLCPPSRHNLVFPNWSGNIDFLSNLNVRGWQPLLKEAGLLAANGRPKYPPKSLRHARASLEIEKGANPKEIKKLMGHSSIKITYDVYGHLFEAHNDRRANRANVIAAELIYRTPTENVTNM